VVAAGDSWPWTDDGGAGTTNLVANLASDDGAYAKATKASALTGESADELLLTFGIAAAVPSQAIVTSIAFSILCDDESSTLGGIQFNTIRWQANGTLVGTNATATLPNAETAVSNNLAGLTRADLVAGGLTGLKIKLSSFNITGATAVVRLEQVSITVSYNLGNRAKTMTRRQGLAA